MSEVKRWKLKGFLPGVEGECKAVFQPTVVMADDFDRVTAENFGLQALLTAADERADRLEADKKAMTETHVLYTWLRKKCDQPSNDVVAVHMNIGHDWITVYDLDTDLRAMIEREEP